MPKQTKQGGDKPPTRSARFYGRCTPEVKRRAMELAEAEGCSVADLFERWVNQAYTARPNKSLHRNAQAGRPTQGSQ